MEILGNSKVRALLERSLETAGPAPAYLFVGPRGVGKGLVARWLAAWLCCPGPGRPCGSCPACRRVASGNHPDVTVLERVEGKASLGVDDVRGGIREVQYRPYEGGYRAWLLPEAERLTEEAQSALLKTLEEPPEHLVLVLVAGTEEALMPTVTSRCRILRFGPLDPAEVERLLVAHGVPAERAAVLARVGGGSPGAALDLARTAGLWELREAALRAAAGLPEADLGQALEAASALEALKTDSTDPKADLERVLEAMLTWFRDALCLAAGGDESLLLNVHHRDRLREVAARRTPGQLEAALRLVMEAGHQSRRNVNPRLLLQRMCLEIGRPR